MNNKSTIKKHKLQPSTENTGVSIHPACIVGYFLTSEMYKVLGNNYPTMLCKFRDGTNQWANNLDEGNNISLSTIDRIKNDSSFVEDIYSAYKIEAKKLGELIEQLLKANIGTDLPSLIQLYHQYNHQYQETYLYSWLPLGAEGLNANLSGELIARISERIRKFGLDISVGECFGVLTKLSSLSVRQREQVDFCEVHSQFFSEISKIVPDKFDLQHLIRNNKYLYELLDQHYKKYRWMAFDYEGPELSIEHFESDLIDRIFKGISPEEIKADILEEVNFSIEYSKKLWEQLQLNNDHELSRLVKIAQLFTSWKGEQQELLFQSYHAIDHILELIAQKINIDKVLLRYLLPNEIDGFIDRRKPDINQLEKRRRYCVVLFEDGKINIYCNSEADDLWNRMVEQEKIIETDILHGQAAYPGKVQGIAKIINDMSELDKVQKGDILVSSKTNPNLVPAMRRALAIVTDYGGLTCHAAILSHELKVPTVVGTKYATKLLADGMLVEVNAFEGKVRILEK